MTTENETSNTYKGMWDSFGKNRDSVYFNAKFTPNYRIGLTNFLREELMIDLAAPGPSDVILDVGCSAGRQVFAMAKTAEKVHGVDIAQTFIDTANDLKAKYGARNTEFSMSAVEDLPFEDGKFDKLICGEVLEHVFDKDAALDELLRVLRPGGALVVSVPNLNADGTWWGRLLRCIGMRSFSPIEVFSLEELAKHGDSHVREYTPAGIRAWFGARGMVIERMTVVSFIDGPWFDTLLKVPLHIGPLRRLTISIERCLSRRNFLWGRHIVFRARKAP
tara:strand:+ start:10179 stop:11009 length:831 start_codon:yes stop_codon:yes gene_type:complete